MRVFIGPVEVAGFYASLRRGLEAAGVRVMIADLAADVRRYDGGPRSPVVRLAEWASSLAGRTAPGQRTRVVWLSRLASLARVGLLLWAAVRCRVFVYGFGTTITFYPELELRLLRRLGKRIVHVFHGSDSRPPYLEARLVRGDHTITAAERLRATAEVKAAVDRAHRYGDAVLDNPFGAQLHPGPCVNVHVIGNPFPAPAEAPLPPAGPDAVRVLHSPSDPHLKGTDVIRAAIARLQARGRRIDYVELTGRPHAEVIEELQRCDFVVDQAYSDTPMANFATEAAAYGRPAVVGGYAGPHLERYVPDPWMPPVLYVHPSELEDAIDRLVTDADERRRLGAAARAYVRRERAPEAVARRLLRVIEGDVPADWWFDPRAVEYVNGLGEEGVVRRLVRELVAHGGAGALQLGHSPALAARVLAFAGAELAPADEARLAGSSTP